MCEQVVHVKMADVVVIRVYAVSYCFIVEFYNTKTKDKH
jgi:hypothetical protein